MLAKTSLCRRDSRNLVTTASRAGPDPEPAAINSPTASDSTSPGAPDRFSATNSDPADGEYWYRDAAYHLGKRIDASWHISWLETDAKTVPMIR